MLVGLVLLFGGVLLLRAGVKDDHPLNPVLDAIGAAPLPAPGHGGAAGGLTGGAAYDVGAGFGKTLVGLPSAAPSDPLVLTAGQVAALARQAGFSGAEVPIMVAIAFRESRFDAHAVNPDPGVCGPPNATGLWQICPGGAAMLDPTANAHAAREKYLASQRAGYSGYRPWGGPIAPWGGG